MLLESDVRKVTELVERVSRLEVAEVVREMTGATADAAALQLVTDCCVFDHAGTLVFPGEQHEVTDLLRRLGAVPRQSVPSVMVRERLARRYERPLEALDVTIVHADVGPGTGRPRELEIFCLRQDQAEPAMIRRETQEDNESHLALRVTAPTHNRLCALRTALVEDLGLCVDGGGYHPNEEIGGRTVLYFKAASGARMELLCSGHFPSLLDLHLCEEQQQPEPPHALLTLLSGHWAARAVHVFAKWRIADLLSKAPKTAGEVSAAMRSDPQSTARLLRYLDSLGVVRRTAADTFVLTPVGELLRSEARFRDLAVLYGEEFYQAWADFPYAVDSGRSAFGRSYGVEHFDYFAAHPTAARRFDRAMSAVSSLMAEELGRCYPFPDGATVVDVGGGDGTVLREVLREHPDVNGIVVDRDHVAAAAQPQGRLRSEAADFFTRIPAGHEIYLLSRVLHDWSDVDCVRILEVCRTACPPDAVLLVVERLLPEDRSASLAQAWDMQMLAITGGRERTESEYAALLNKTGFAIHDTVNLPVDLRLLICRTTDSDRDPRSQTPSGVASLP